MNTPEITYIKLGPDGQPVLTTPTDKEATPYIRVDCTAAIEITERTSMYKPGGRDWGDMTGACANCFYNDHDADVWPCAACSHLAPIPGMAS